MEIDKSLVSGSMALLVLKLLEDGDKYGYQMIEELRRRSNDTFHLKAGTLYPLLHGLEEKGLVERKRDTQDKRSSILEVRERAKDIIEEGRRAQKEYHDLVFGSLSDDELKELGRLQKIIEKNIKENL